MVAALAPSLMFLGHWSVSIPVPGTGWYVGMPATPHRHTEESDDGHERHCHADAASCGDVPFAGASAFALLTDTVVLLGASGLLMALTLRYWEPSLSATIAPERRPPRFAAAT